MRGSAFGVGDDAGRFSGEVGEGLSGQGDATGSECPIIVGSVPAWHPCV